MGPKTVWTRYSFFWVTLALFLITLSGHWIFGWLAYVREQQAQGQAVEVAGYTIEMMRDTLEVAGLAFLFHIGSPQSKEGDDRMEAKIDAILLAVEPKKGEALMREIDKAYDGRHTDERFVLGLERKKPS